MWWIKDQALPVPRTVCTRNREIMLHWRQKCLGLGEFQLWNLPLWKCIVKCTIDHWKYARVCLGQCSTRPSEVSLSWWAVAWVTCRLSGKHFGDPILLGATVCVVHHIQLSNGILVFWIRSSNPSYTWLHDPHEGVIGIQMSQNRIRLRWQHDKSHGRVSLSHSFSAIGLWILSWLPRYIETLVGCGTRACNIGNKALFYPGGSRGWAVVMLFKLTAILVETQAFSKQSWLPTVKL